MAIGNYVEPDPVVGAVGKASGGTAFPPTKSEHNPLAHVEPARTPKIAFFSYSGKFRKFVLYFAPALRRGEGGR